MGHILGEINQILLLARQVLFQVNLGESPSTMDGSLPPSGNLVIDFNGNIDVASDGDANEDNGDSDDAKTTNITSMATIYKKEN